MVSAQDAKNFEDTINETNPLSAFLEKYGLLKDVSYVQKVEKPNPAWTEWKQKQEENKTDLYALFSGIVGTSDTVQNTGAQGHYYRALKDNNAGCYLHVLNVLLDYNGTSLSCGTFDTSLKDPKDPTKMVPVTLDGLDVNMTTAQMTAEEKQKMSEISGLLGQRYCDGDDDFNTSGNQNLLEAARTAGSTPTELEILRSDFIEIQNEDRTYSYNKK